MDYFWILDHHSSAGKKDPLKKAMALWGMQTQGFWPTMHTVEDYSESLTSECAVDSKAIKTPKHVLF